jgi:hypothetical protein
VARRNSAKWIVDALDSSSGQQDDLPDFGEITFTSASATIGGAAGPVNAFARQSEAARVAAAGFNDALTSELTSSGESFVVLDQGITLDGGALQSKRIRLARTHISLASGQARSRPGKPPASSRAPLHGMKHRTDSVREADRPQALGPGV